LGKAEDARDAYRRGMEITQKLAEAEPTSFKAQTDHIFSLSNLGRYQQRASLFDEAAASYERGLIILNRLEQAGKLAARPKYVDWRKDLKKELAFCRVAPRAIADLDLALKQAPALVPRLLLLRIRVLAREGRHDDANTTADRLCDCKPTSPINLYNAACGYTLCVSATARDRPPEKLSVEERAARERYAARAVAVLRQAVEKGYKDLAHMQKDADLDPLRARDDFKKLLAGLEAKPKAAPK
jgi:tetratricopeptide (TPR) repeat protein